MLAQRLSWIVWPAFLVAGVLEMVVFALVDPHELHWLGWPLEMSRAGFYTLSFFLFWALTLVSSALTAWLAQADIESHRDSQSAHHGSGAAHGAC